MGFVRDTGWHFRFFLKKNGFGVKRHGAPQAVKSLRKQKTKRCAHLSALLSVLLYDFGSLDTLVALGRDGFIGLDRCVKFFSNRIQQHGSLDTY